MITVKILIEQQATTETQISVEFIPRQSTPAESALATSITTGIEKFLTDKLHAKQGPMIFGESAKPQTGPTN